MRTKKVVLSAVLGTFVTLLAGADAQFRMALRAGADFAERPSYMMQYRFLKAVLAICVILPFNKRNNHMLRTFAEHKVRVASSLDGIWEFVPTGETAPNNDTYKVMVPSAWETVPGLESYRGQARYRRTFELETPAHVRLAFGGVSHTGKVYVDGEFVGTHYDAFTPWDVLAPGLDAGEHELVVEVDNTFGDHSALHKENDYYTYGGITRPVELQLVPDVYIDKVFAWPIMKDEGWSLDVRVVLHNVGSFAHRRAVRASVAGITLELDSVEIAPGGTVEVSSRSPIISDVNAWTADSPSLYMLRVELLDDGDVADDKIDRIGFRQVELQGKEFLVTGKSIRLRGYNRHEDHAIFGNALPVEAMIMDLQIMEDLGCNFVRTSHYPNDMRFLDLCDELGFYVWEESHARGTPFDSPRFDEQIEASTREMLEWHYNHASIVIWGCLNECDARSDHGQEVYARVLNQIKAFDPHRPNTYASHHRKNDKCCKHADIISLNIYTGWYADPIEKTRAIINDLLAWIHSGDSGGAEGKPVIMSEFGGGAIPGNHQRSRSRWSEEYQRDVLDETLRIYLNHDDIFGASIWQFCDCRATETLFANRPRTLNNKGTVDEYRRPKLAYDVVKARMIEATERWDQ